MSTGTPPIQTSADEKRVEMDTTKTGQNESQAAAVVTTGSNETRTVMNGTTGSNETHAETNESKTGKNETGTVSNSTQSSNANQTAGAAAQDSSAESPPVLSIFLVNDLQYDIFPVNPETGSMCDTDPGKYPSMGFVVRMAMRIEVRYLGM